MKQLIKRTRVFWPIAATLAAAGLCSGSAKAAETTEEMMVWGKTRPVKDSDYAAPESILTPQDFTSINAATTEDLLKYEPNVIIRNRFIGDTLGTVGMRGSNMFQTTRTMVFADGVPLHYFLQTRWLGSPRWSLVSAGEIAQVEVLYGPYSAEYSGNAMGGVINIETAIPTGREFRLQGSFYNQRFDAVGFDDNLNGHKAFLSYGDKLGDFSLYTSFNRLENNSQPMDFLVTANTTPAGGEQDVSGAIRGRNEYSQPVTYFGDTGSVQSINENLKLKIGYDFSGWSMLFNIAHEDRESIRDTPNNYLRSPDGQPVWQGNVMQSGIAFAVESDDFAISAQDRQSLLLGGRLQGALTDNWWMEVTASVFNILEDETRDSLSNPRDPAYTLAGEVTDFDNTGWETAEVKIQNDNWLGKDSLSLVSGIRHEHYSLEVSTFSSDNFASGAKTALSSTSGGETVILAGFAQLGWQVNNRWDLAFGGRYENWKSQDGFFDDSRHNDRNENRFSPKFSAGFVPNDAWQYRYSLAKAYRFPIAEELFQNERRTQGTTLADADLEPEEGMHQNLMLQRNIEGGYLRINIFTETVNDVIFAQTTVINNAPINTFIPVDEVQTEGLEFIVNKFNIMNGKLDLRFNVSYANTEIIENRANRALEGKTFPRMPEWRANLLATYHISDRWDFGGGIRYAGDSFGDLNNSDTEDNVFGAFDAYTFVNLKSSYQFNDHFKLSAGVENLTNEIAYVHHPWPGRTLFIESAIDF